MSIRSLFKVLLILWILGFIVSFLIGLFVFIPSSIN